MHVGLPTISATAPPPAHFSPIRATPLSPPYSHSVFTLYIRGTHAGKGVVVNGTLNMVDLAGSERLDRSKAEGDRRKEAASINKSLR